MIFLVLLTKNLSRLLLSSIVAIHGQRVRLEECGVGDVATTCVTKFVGRDETKEELLSSIQRKITMNGMLESEVLFIQISNSEKGTIDRIPSELFSTYPHLKVLRIDLPITEITSTDLVNAKRLVALSLWISSKVRKLSVGTFPHIKLELLMLEANEIGTIDDFAFQNLTVLTHLDLSKNRLAKINRNTFTGLLALRHLKMSENKIRSIENGAFTDLGELLTLELHGNQLKSLKDETFVGLHKIQSLYIGGNQIERIGNSLYCLNSLIIIQAQLNPIEDIDLVKFAQLPKLIALHLRNTSSTGLNLDTYNISSEFLSNSKLTELHLDSNNITNAENLKALRVFPKLTWLDLQHNNLRESDVKNVLGNFLEEFWYLSLKV